MAKNQAGKMPKVENVIHETSEMSSWAIEGAILGALIGMVVGLLFSIAFVMGFIDLPVVNKVLDGSMLIYLVAPLVGAFLGGFAGILVGIGTPKFNPFPQQGDVKRWKSLLVMGRKGLARFFVPEHDRKRNY